MDIGRHDTAPLFLFKGLGANHHALWASFQPRERGAMDRFLIEVPHTAEPASCARVVKIFLETGSHYLTHAEWGCADGVHSAYIIAESNDHDEARMIVPPAYRDVARVVYLKTYRITDIDEMLADHEG